MKNFDGKVALITGGAAGIGAAMARLFAAEGMRLVLADINAQALELTAKEFRDQGVDVLAVPVDVSDRGQIDSLLAQTLAHCGAPHLLCSNVGLIMFDALENMTEQAWQRIWSINVMGVINIVNAFLPHMKQLEGEKHITLTSSMYGFISAPRMGAYVTSKYAIMGYGETLKTELESDDIGVTIIFPTMVGTEHLKNSTDILASQLADHGVKQSDLEAYIDVAATHCQTTLPPDQALRNLVDDIRHNRLYSVTHDGPTDTFSQRSTAILKAIARADR